MYKMIRAYVNLGTKAVSSATQKCQFKRMMLTNTSSPSMPLLKNPSSLIQNPQNLLILRHASKKSKRKGESETDTDSYTSENPEGEFQDKNTKVMKVSVTSLRIDGILRSALGMARNKIEVAFYENKIRVNGEKISKKSATVQEGDEVDLIKGPDVKNPNFIYVARVEVLSIKPDEDSISVKVKRCKSLLIEAYDISSD